MSIIGLVLINIVALSAAYACTRYFRKNSSNNENMGCLIAHLCFYSGAAAVSLSFFYIRDYFFRPDSSFFPVLHPAVLVLCIVSLLALVGLYLGWYLGLRIGEHRLWKYNPRAAEKKMKEWDESPHNPQNFM